MLSRNPPAVSDESVQLAPGDVVARKYRLLEPLGEGGMAVVWVALNMALETRVAIKILRASLASDARVVARVRQEAKATAAIAHKNIVQVYDYGVTGWGAPYIVMELMEGETLAARLKQRGRLPAADAVRILLRAMKGVTVAHAKGIIHRDLKTENIFLAVEDNGTERPKVLDFGVSFVSREGAEDRLTHAGGMVGTPSYLPPEAIAGENRGDARGDVWAFGVLLHETITGGMPFTGKSIHALLQAIVHEPHPPMSAVVPDIDPELQAIVDRALAKDPEQRHPGVRELFDELNGWLGARGELGSSSRMPSGHLALPPDPLTDEEDPTLVGPSLDHSGSLPQAPPESRRTPLPPARAQLGSRPSGPPGLYPARPPLGWGPNTPSPSAPPARRSSPSPLPSALMPPRPPLFVLTLGAGAVLLGLLLLGVGNRWARSSVAAAHAPAPRAPSSESAAPSSSLAPPPGASLGAAPPAAPPPEDVSSVVQAQGSLDILALPAGALVRVNGGRVELPVRLSRGSTAHVRVDAPGYLPWSQDVAAEGAVRLTYAGAPAPRSLPTPSGWAGGQYKDVPY